MSKPSPTSHPSYFKKYIDLVPEQDLHQAFLNQLPIITTFLNTISEEKSTFAYAPDKWTIKELMQHITDTERVFAYRSFCFARKELASLPGFDENIYAENSNANNRTWQSIIDEFFLVRKNTELLFSGFSDDVLNYSGIANNNPANVNSMGFTAIGHVYHHLKIIKERYL